MGKEDLKCEFIKSIKNDAYRHAEQFKGLISPIGGDLGIKRIAEAFMMGAIHQAKRARIAKLEKEKKKR